MKIKRNLLSGSLAACLGLSLISGGTWAAFNDKETATASVQAGTLDLKVYQVAGEEDTFNVSNLKPGDSMVRVFGIDNIGSLAIKEVLLSAMATNFVNGTNEYVEDTGLDNTLDEYLDQFQVQLLSVVSRSIIDLDPNAVQQLLDDYLIINPFNQVSLKDFVNGNFPSGVLTSTDGRLNVAPNNEWTLFYDGDQFDGLPVQPDDKEWILISIKMKDDLTKETSGPAAEEYVQNRFEGDSAQITFSLEATQWDGQEIVNNGYVEDNEKAHNGNY